MDDLKGKQSVRQGNWYNTGRCKKIGQIPCFFLMTKVEIIKGGSCVNLILLETSLVSVPGRFFFRL